MNLQDKIALLKNEIERRNTSPNANEVWSSIEHTLTTKRRKKRTFWVSSIILISLTLSYLFINCNRYPYTQSDISRNNTIGYLPNHKRQHTDSKAHTKKNAPVSIDQNRHLPALSGNSSYRHGRNITMEPYTTKSTPGKVSYSNAQTNARNTNMSSKFSNNTKELKNSLHEDESISNAYVQEEKNNGLKMDVVVDSGETVNDSAVIAKKNNEPQKPSIDSIPQKAKKWILRPYFGFVFNQLKPFSVPGKPYSYSIFSNYSTGLLLDYSIHPKTMLTFNLGFVKLPSKIEFLKKDSNSSDQIIKVLNTNNLITGLEYAQFNSRKNFSFNIGTQITISGKKRNYVEQAFNNASVFNQQKTLPKDFQNNYFAKFDFLFNTGINFYKRRSILRINYYQGLTDVSRTTRLFNPHAFIQINYAFQLFRF